MCCPLEKCVVLCSQKWPFPNALRTAFNVLTIKEMFVLVMCYIKYFLDIIKDYSSLYFFFSFLFSWYVGGNVKAGMGRSREGPRSPGHRCFSLGTTWKFFQSL